MTKTTDRFFEEILNKHEAGEKISTGAGYAYRAWRFSSYNESSEFECEDLPSDNDMKDFVDTSKASGIGTLAITEQSTALMRNLHTLESLGCEMLGLCKVARIKSEFKPDEKTEHNAIRIKL